MSDEKELHELCERIVQLPFGGQTRLLELVLAGNRRRYQEEVARMKAAEAELRELEKLYCTVPAPFAFPPEVKREAG